MKKLLLSLIAVSLLAVPAIGVARSNHHQTVAFTVHHHRPTPTPRPTRTPKPTPTPTPKPTPSPSPTPIPTPTPTPIPSPTPAPVATKGFGIAGQGILWATDVAQVAELADMQSMGMTWLRVDSDWSSIQPNNATTSDWANLDRLATNSAKYGIQLDLILDGTPVWGRNNSSCTVNQFCAPNPTKFATFAKAVVTRYAPLGVHSYEVWNEANLTGFWEPAPNATAYTTLLKTTYPVIKAADPKSTVISNGLSPLATYARGQSSDIPTTDFETTMYQQGAKNYFDAFGFHPYGYPATPNSSFNWSGFYILTDETPSVRSIMVANGDSAKQVWFTEFGAPTNGPGTVTTCANYPNFPSGTDHVDECLQSTIAAQGIAKVKSYSWGGPLFFYTYTDFSMTDTSTNENFFGLIRADGTHKPVYDTIKSAITTP